MKIACFRISYVFILCEIRKPSGSAYIIAMIDVDLLILSTIFSKIVISGHCATASQVAVTFTEDRKSLPGPGLIYTDLSFNR